MPRLHSNRDRPFHLGTLPTERLARSADAPEQPARQPVDAHPAGADALTGAIPEYRALIEREIALWKDVIRKAGVKTQ